MSNNTTATNTMSKTDNKTAPKRVAKKSEAVAAPAPAAAAAPKKAAKASPAAPVAEVPVASTPTEAVAVPVVSVSEQVQTMLKELSAIRDAASKTIAGLRKLERQHSREVKEAKRRRRVKKEDGETKEARPSVFTTPILLKDTLAVFLGKEKGTKMSPAEVTKAFKVYIDTHGLKGEKHAINPDAAMRSVLGLAAGETLSYRSIQSYLYKLYIKA
jgi:chromatin remodeling complex protein RSC6